MRFPLVLFLGLAACGDWPDAGGPPLSQARGWPELVPINGLAQDIPEATSDDATRLAARAAGLRRRAALLRARIDTRDDMEALRARLSR